MNVKCIMQLIISDTMRNSYQKWLGPGVSQITNQALKKLFDQICKIYITAALFRISN